LQESEVERSIRIRLNNNEDIPYIGRKKRERKGPTGYTKMKRRKEIKRC